MPEIQGIPAMLQSVLEQLNRQHIQLDQLQSAQRPVLKMTGGIQIFQGWFPQALLQNANVSSGSSAPLGMVDTRQLRKPEVFKGHPQEYAEWAFIFKAYLACRQCLPAGRR